MKKILVTGGAGYIGSHTVVELVTAGYEAIIVDDFSNSSAQVLARLKSITCREISFYQGSVSDKEFMNRVFEENHIDAVIHFAAYKAVGESVQEPLKYYKNNVCGTISLLDVMKLHKVEHIIFSS
ncbi:SDR family NAD(P)-dependent oxidoreductase, partial [Campylobacter jejuni]